MKIAFYDTKEYDRASFHPYEDDALEFRYLEERLSEETVDLAAGCEGVCVFVNDTVSAKVIDQLHASGVRFILLRCAGYNNVNLEHCRKLKMPVFRVPAYSPYAVAEHAMAMLLTSIRRIHKAYNRTREFNFSLSGLTGFDLHGKTAGVIGTGRIGRAFINICRGFGMNVLAYDKFPSPEIETAARALKADGALPAERALKADGGLPAERALKADGALSAERALKADGALPAERALKEDGALSAGSVLKAEPALKADDALPAERALKADDALPAESALKADGALSTERALKADDALPAESALKAEPALSAERALKEGDALPAERALKEDGALSAERALKAGPALSAETALPAEPDSPAPRALSAENALKADGALSAPRALKAASALTAESPLKEGNALSAGYAEKAGERSGCGCMDCGSVRYVPLGELFEKSDIISLHCPLTDETHHIIDAAAITAMKKGVVIVNTSRGALIDAESLLAGIKNRQIGAVCLDVYEEEAGLFFNDFSGHIISDDVIARLISMPNVLVTSHQAFLTKEALSAIAETTVDNIYDYVEKGGGENEVAA